MTHAAAEAFSTWVHAHGYYFLSFGGNSQAALAIFVSTLVPFLLVSAWDKRRNIDDARAKIPLVIGGWGTRGKSGTERLKAGLFHGLGYEVFVKTTGCEAMMIHSAPGHDPVEMFLFRPYDKSTIWEQRDMLELGARLDSEVFLWECMALNPVYVQILQREWMRDDISTVTNSYPDHEDIMGPRGFDVAEVISCFVPDRSTLVTTEQSYLPLFEDRCRERGSEIAHVGKRAGDLIASDVLALFPYNEHPRNVSLVARVAQELGIDRAFAIATMAQNVVPDLGVLKAFAPVRVAGRVMTFLNGCSANDPTGTLGNWKRMGCDRFDPDDPAALMVTVVNNRADRIARSAVFARMLVENLPADRHVLIGTNLEGLQGLIGAALKRFTGELQVVLPAELAAGEPAGPRERLARHLAHVRVPPPTTARALARLRVFAAGAGFGLDDARLPALEREIAALFEPLGGAGEISLAAARAELDAAPFSAALDGALRSGAVAPVAEDPPEVLAPASREDVLAHFRRQLARMIVRARLEHRLDGLTARGAQAVAHFHAEFRRAFSELFMDTIEVVADAGATGDQVIQRCALTSPPGTKVALMGLQNIKGTGLDFVYRWIAIDKTLRVLPNLKSPLPARRLQALRDLEVFEDYGLVDLALARRALREMTPEGGDENERRSRVCALLDSKYEQHRDALAGAKETIDRPTRLLHWLEGWIDYIDAVRRRRQADQLVEDLANQRISHRQASFALRELYYRQKGGWLAKAFRRRRARTS